MTVDYLAAIEQSLRDAFDEYQSQLVPLGADITPLLDGIWQLLASGKRLRPQFAYWGWRASGQDDAQVAHAVAASFEFFQAGALLHDDVMDRSDLRRGHPTLHKSLEKTHIVDGMSGDAEQYGQAGAILAGDLCLAWNDQLYTSAITTAGNSIDSVWRDRSRHQFDLMRAQLMAGQFLDISVQAQGFHDDGLQRALRVVTYKSAKYSVEAPLLIGATLGGASDALCDSLSAYGLALGQAFQLRDDELGVFGDTSITGKPAGDDLREGKQTALVALADSLAAPAERTRLRTMLGNPHLSHADVSDCQEIIVSCGARDQLEELIQQGVEKAHNALAAITLNDEVHTALNDLLHHSTARRA